MNTLYKKCEKSLDNPYGVEKIEDLSNYDKPFLLCISPQDMIDKSVFGIIKEGARAARVRTSDEYASGFKIDEMPIDFLGIKYEPKSIKDSKTVNLLNDFIYPFLTRGDNILSQARKINFFTYCNGTTIYKELEKRLIEKLREDNYQEDQIKEIISQISLVSIGSEVDTSKLYATSITIKDVNDREVFDEVSKYALKRMDTLNRQSIIGKLRSKANSIIYVYNGTGEHELKEYFKEGNIVKTALCAAVTYLLENSVLNQTSEQFIPISSDTLMKTVMRHNAEFEPIEDILSRIDNNIKYNGTIKYTKEEDKLLKELDKVYKKLIKTQRMLESTSNELNKANEDKQKLISGIREKTSDIAFEQIVVGSGMWQNARRNNDFMNQKTDRQIREEYEDLLSQNESKIIQK